MDISKISSDSLIRNAEELCQRISAVVSPLENSEIWSLHQSLQNICGHLLLGFQEIALEKGVERDLWNLGFRPTITQLQSQAKDKKKGNNDVRDVLNWFLNAASGFYLQLFNQICSVNNLDLIFRRKDNYYQFMGGPRSSVELKQKDGVTKNALYLCQYCLIHLGDLARYRHQAKQAETYYRHAVRMAATSGHPYNQLALLEAGRGRRLASLFLVMRAICLPAPFPGALSNLVQTLSRALNAKPKELEMNISNSSNSEAGSPSVGLSRLTKEEYVTLFLATHSCLLLQGDVTAARNALPKLASALSVLAATMAVTKTTLVQMFAVNVFSAQYFRGRIAVKGGDDNKKEEQKLVHPKEAEGALEIIEELTMGMLAALLLPVHTMKESDVAVTYPAMPAIRLMLEWLWMDGSWLGGKKKQIWPGVAALVNVLQEAIKQFMPQQYEHTPLPEDWDLQEFQPLHKMLCKYKYSESACPLSPEDATLLRAHRLTQIALKLCQKSDRGPPLLKNTSDKESVVKLLAVSNPSLPEQEVRDLQRLTSEPLQTQTSTKQQHSLSRRRTEASGIAGILKAPHHNSLPPKDLARDVEKKLVLDKRSVVTTSPTVTAGSVTVAKPRSSGHTNVALQAILKRTSSSAPETKQVTFKTPVPSVSPISSTPRPVSPPALKNIYF